MTGVLVLVVFFVAVVGLVVLFRLAISFGYSLIWFRQGPRGFEVKANTGKPPVLREKEKERELI